MAIKNHWAMSFANNTVAAGPSTQAEYFSAVGAKAVPGKWYTTLSGVWLSAGAGYGPQVEFDSEAAADAFVKTHPGAFRSTGTTAPRVNVTSKAMFVAAFEAAKGKAAVKSEPVAMVDATVDVDEDLEALRDLKALRTQVDPVVAAKAAYVLRLAALGASPEEIEILVAKKFA